MTQHPFIQSILLTLIIGIISCKGQVNQEQPKEKISAPPIIPTIQPKLIKTQGSSDGENVHDGLQDKAGNIWFTNWGGTYRYDGKSFTTFTEKDGLCDGAITRIIEDKKGNLWFGIGSSTGVCRYDGNTFDSFSEQEE